MGRAPVLEGVYPPPPLTSLFTLTSGIHPQTLAKGRDTRQAGELIKCSVLRICKTKKMQEKVAAEQIPPLTFT